MCREFPPLFVAMTLKVYVSPFVNPVTVIGEDPPVTRMSPGLDMTVYETTGVKKSPVGPVNVMVACPFPPTALAFVGGPGTTVGTLAI